jgi:hypothetical protein
VFDRKLDRLSVTVIDHDYANSLQIRFKGVIKKNEYTMNPLAIIGMMLHGIVDDKIATSDCVQMHDLQNIKMLQFSR